MPSQHGGNGISDLRNSLAHLSYERNQERVVLLPKQQSVSSSNVSKVYYSENTTIATEDEDEYGKQTAESQTVREASTARKCIVMIACLYINMAAFGMNIALGVIYVELISAFNSPRAQAALVQSLYMGTALGGGVLFSGIIKKYKAGDLIIISSIIATVALLTSSFGNSLPVIIVLVGVVAGLAIGLNILGSFVVVNWMFADKRKTALGLLTLGSTIGQTLMPVVTNALVESYNWDGALFIISALLTFNCVACGLLLRYSDEYFIKEDGKKTATTKGAKWINCLTDLPFIVYLAVIVVVNLTSMVEQLFAVDLIVSRGYSRESGANLLSVNGLLGCIGRLSASFMLFVRPNTRPELHLSYAFIIWGLGHFLIIQFSGYLEMTLSMMLRGFMAGLSVSFLPSMQLELRGRDNYPQTLAISNFLVGASMASGGFLGGYSVDVTGSYDVIFYIAAISSAICGLGFILIHFMIKNKNVSNKLSNNYQTF